MKSSLTEMQIRLPHPSSVPTKYTKVLEKSHLTNVFAIA